MLLKQSGFPGCLGFRGDLICAGGHGLALVSAEAVAMPVFGRDFGGSHLGGGFGSAYSGGFGRAPIAPSFAGPT
jgi:hypothetical protein